MARTRGEIWFFFFLSVSPRSPHVGSVVLSVALKRYGPMPSECPGDNSCDKLCSSQERILGPSSNFLRELRELPCSLSHASLLWSCPPWCNAALRPHQANTVMFGLSALKTPSKTNFFHFKLVIWPEDFVVVMENQYLKTGGGVGGVKATLHLRWLRSDSEIS